jgi:hypothetical protein
LTSFVQNSTVFDFQEIADSLKFHTDKDQVFNNGNIGQLGGRHANAFLTYWEKVRPSDVLWPLAVLCRPYKPYFPLLLANGDPFSEGEADSF